MLSFDPRIFVDCSLHRTLCPPRLRQPVGARECQHLKHDHPIAPVWSFQNLLSTHSLLVSLQWGPWSPVLPREGQGSSGSVHTRLATWPWKLLKVMIKHLFFCRENSIIRLNGNSMIWRLAGRRPAIVTKSSNAHSPVTLQYHKVGTIGKGSKGDWHLQRGQSLC